MCLLTRNIDHKPPTTGLQFQPNGTLLVWGITSTEDETSIYVPVVIFSLQTQEEAGNYNDEDDATLGSNDNLMRAWFRAKCLADSSWCQ